MTYYAYKASLHPAFPSGCSASLQGEGEINLLIPSSGTPCHLKEQSAEALGMKWRGFRFASGEGAKNDVY
jgi:hypothetical protein